MGDTLIISLAALVVLAALIAVTRLRQQFEATDKRDCKTTCSHHHCCH